MDSLSGSTDASQYDLTFERRNCVELVYARDNLPIAIVLCLRQPQLRVVTQRRA
jgi:hypothetical protein